MSTTQDFKEFINAQNPVAVIPQRVLAWKDGLPFPSEAKLITKPAIEQGIRAAMSTPYRGYWDKDQGCYVMEADFIGMSNYEVMVVRLAGAAANGDLDAIKEVMNRTIGKPKQAIETVSMSMTYQDFLEQKAKEMEQPQTLRVNDL